MIWINISFLTSNKNYIVRHGCIILNTTMERKFKLYIFCCFIKFTVECRNPKSGECWNPNDRSFEQTCLDFRPFGSFDRSDFGAYSIKYSGMPKSVCSNRLVWISDDIFCLKSEQIVRISALFSVRAIFGTENKSPASHNQTCSDFGIPL